MKLLTTLALSALIGVGAALAAPGDLPSPKSPTDTVLTVPTPAKMSGSKQLHDGGALHPGERLNTDGSVDRSAPRPAPIGEPKTPASNVKTDQGPLTPDVLDGTQKQDSVDRSGAEELKGGKGLSFALVPDELPITAPAQPAQENAAVAPPVTITAEEIRASEATADMHQNRMSPLEDIDAPQPVFGAPANEGDPLVGPSTDQQR